jgi:hypothetical protein
MPGRKFDSWTGSPTSGVDPTISVHDARSVIGIARADLKMTRSGNSKPVLKAAQPDVAIRFRLICSGEHSIGEWGTVLSRRIKRAPSVNIVYAETLQWFLVAALCVTPGIIAAAFGRGPFMVISAVCSVFALFRISPIGAGPFVTFRFSNEFWYWQAAPLGIAVICACVAIIQERRSGKPPCPG